MRDRPQTGPLMVLAGAAGLLAVSLLTWYEVDLDKIEGGRAVIGRFARANDFATSANAWQPWGPAAGLLLALVILAGLALAGGTIGGALGGPLPALGAILAGSLGTALVLLHIISGPDPQDIVAVRPPAWFGLLCCLAILGGGFLWWDRAAHPRPGEPAAD